jgi:hypothetical protein
VELSSDGPFILDHERILKYAARKGLFHVKEENVQRAHSPQLGAGLAGDP